jgi:hypothetical protein
MPDEPVTVVFTADYASLDIYVQEGTISGRWCTPTRELRWKPWLRRTQNGLLRYVEPGTENFHGKAVRYVTIEQLVESAHTYDSAVRYDAEDCL